MSVDKCIVTGVHPEASQGILQPPSADDLLIINIVTGVRPEASQGMLQPPSADDLLIICVALLFLECHRWGHTPDCVLSLSDMHVGVNHTFQGLVSKEWTPYYWWVILHCMCMGGKTIFTLLFHNTRQITRRKNRSIRPLCFPSGFVVKNLPVIQETWVGSLGWEDPLEKEMATHCSILAWGIPWTEEPGGLQSVGSQRGEHDLVTKTTNSFCIQGSYQRNLSHSLKCPKSSP